MISSNEIVTLINALGLDPKAELWKLPASHVGEYAEQDAAITLRLWHHLRAEISHQNLINIFELDTNLFPVLFDMKQKGVRVDLDKAEKIKTNLEAKENDILRSIKKLVGAKLFEKITDGKSGSDDPSRPSWEQQLVLCFPSIGRDCQSFNSG